MKGADIFCPYSTTTFWFIKLLRWQEKSIHFNRFSYRYIARFTLFYASIIQGKSGNIFLAPEYAHSKLKIKYTAPAGQDT